MKQKHSLPFSYFKIFDSIEQITSKKSFLILIIQRLLLKCFSAVFLFSNTLNEFIPASADSICFEADYCKCNLVIMNDSTPSCNALMQSFNLINLSTMFCGISDIGLFVPAWITPVSESSFSRWSRFCCISSILTPCIYCTPMWHMFDRLLSYSDLPRL